MGSPKRDPLDSSENQPKWQRKRQHNKKGEKRKTRPCENKAATDGREQRRPPPPHRPSCVWVRESCYLICISSRKRKKEKKKKQKEEERVPNKTRNAQKRTFPAQNASTQRGSGGGGGGVWGASSCRRERASGLILQVKPRERERKRKKERQKDRTKEEGTNGRTETSQNRTRARKEDLSSEELSDHNPFQNP